ncbi:MAG: MarR family transcriptional regulator [Sphingomonadaceae bacterium]|nr:MarR family transcriptional regulator [Sphingomonadaceae bacterium]
MAAKGEPALDLARLEASAVFSHLREAAERVTNILAVADDALKDERRAYRHELAARLLAARRGRSRIFGDGLFSDPAWEMLLDLYVREARGVETGVSSLGLASGAPPSTALRWLTNLERRGLVERYRSQNDQRVRYVRLTRTALESFDVYMDEASRWLYSSVQGS